MMRSVAAVLLSVLLVGCATSPHEAVQQLDAMSPKYATVECQQARQMAMQYDDHAAANAGAGLALGLFLGPFGIPVAIAMSASQRNREEAIINELRRHCEGELASRQKTAETQKASQPASVRMQILTELKEKGFITEDEFRQKRSQLVDRILEE